MNIGPTIITFAKSRAVNFHIDKLSLKSEIFTNAIQYEDIIHLRQEQTTFWFKDSLSVLS